MPIREYQCLKCRNVFEKLNPEGEIECPKCGSKDIEKRFSAYSWRFRGLLELINEEEGE